MFDLSGLFWPIAFPFVLAAWLFAGALISAHINRLRAGTDAKADRSRRGPVQRWLRWVFFLSIGYGGLILVASLPSWLHRARLHLRGLPVSAKILSRTQEYDDVKGKQYTLITYEFEAEVDGQRRRFQREGKLRGLQFMPSGNVDVLYNPADPADSRMPGEFATARDLTLSMASFFVLGAGSFALSRRLSRAKAVEIANKAPGFP